MSTDLQIANRAIREIGGQPLTQADFDTPRSVTAKVVTDAFDGAVQDVISAWDWPIARSTVALTADPVAPAGTGFSFRFPYPADYANFWALTDDVGQSDFDYAHEGDYILANTEFPYLRYGVNMTSAATWPPYLVKVLEAKLAAEICVPLASEEGSKQDYENIYRGQLSSSKTLASRQAPPKSYMPDENSGYLNAHYGNGSI